MATIDNGTSPNIVWVDIRMVAEAGQSLDQIVVDFRSRRRIADDEVSPARSSQCSVCFNVAAVFRGRTANTLSDQSCSVSQSGHSVAQ